MSFFGPILRIWHFLTMRSCRQDFNAQRNRPHNSDPEPPCKISGRSVKTANARIVTGGNTFANSIYPACFNYWRLSGGGQEAVNTIQNCRLLRAIQWQSPAAMKMHSSMHFNSQAYIGHYLRYLRNPKKKRLLRPPAELLRLRYDRIAGCPFTVPTG